MNIYRIKYNDYGYCHVLASDYKQALDKFMQWYFDKHHESDVNIKIIELIESKEEVIL